MVNDMKHELIAKDYVLYLIQYYASMQSWSKEQIIGQIVLHIEGEEEDVVRCEHCKHYRNPPHGMCYAWTEPCTNERGYKGDEHCVEPNDFCSYGERKERHEP